MAKKLYDTPNLDQLESGPWPSFVTGLKDLAKNNDMAVDLLGQLEASYETKKGYWKGGTVGVFGYGGGVIPRFTELKDENRWEGDGNFIYAKVVSRQAIRKMNKCEAVGGFMDGPFSSSARRDVFFTAR